MTGEKPENPPAFPCAWCDEVAARKQGRLWLCPKHYRHQQMRVNAKRHGKAVPSYHQLECISTPELLCMDCGRVMNWLSGDGQSTVVTLQHYRDGTFGLVCRSCNTRHAFMADDTYREMPKDHKLCPSCNTVKPLKDFWADNGRSGEIRKKSCCKPCSTSAVLAWRSKNRTHYNSKQREYRAMLKARQP